MPVDRAKAPSVIRASNPATLSRIEACIFHLDTVRQLLDDLSEGIENPMDHPLTIAAKFLQDLHRTCRKLPEDGIEPVSHVPLNTAATRDEIRAPRRRAHFSGTPSRIDSAPELRAFFIARLATHTFTQIRDDIAESFPPNRRTSLTARPAGGNARERT